MCCYRFGDPVFVLSITYITLVFIVFVLLDMEAIRVSETVQTVIRQPCTPKARF